MTELTLDLVAAETTCGRLTTFETVPMDTPARRATSLMPTMSPDPLLRATENPNMRMKRFNDEREITMTALARGIDQGGWGV